MNGRTLRSLPGLELLPLREARALAKAGREVTHPAGATVMKQGAGAAALHVVIDGALQVLIDGRAVNALGPGSIVGEMAFLDDSARTATVVATTPVRLFAVSAWSVKPLLDACPTFRALLQQQAARRKAETERDDRGDTLPT